MKYNIAESKLKNLGYTFQKLYAANYKTYRKEINGYKLWLWSKNKQIEINDWYGHTEAILNFYKANINDPGFDIYSKLKESLRGYIVVQMNPKNGFVQLRDQETYFKALMSHDWDEWDEKYDGWYNEIVLSRDGMNAIINEIKILQGDETL